MHSHQAALDDWLSLCCCVGVLAMNKDCMNQHHLFDALTITISSDNDKSLQSILFYIIIHQQQQQQPAIEHTTLIEVTVSCSFLVQLKDISPSFFFVRYCMTVSAVSDITWRACCGEEAGNEHMASLIIFYSNYSLYLIKYFPLDIFELVIIHKQCWRTFSYTVHKC